MNFAEALEIFGVADRLLVKVTGSQCKSSRQKFLIDKFMTAKSDLEKVNFAFKLLEDHDMFPRFVQDGKSDDIAKMHKEDGNQKFASGLYLEALEIYTCSIKTAESKDVLALAYANRSACLFKLKIFQECLVDIERAVKNGYPDNLRGKLFTRRKAALKALKPVQPWHEEIPTIPESRRNKLIQCAKDCVEIRSSEQFGRHIVATRDISIGEVFVVEEPYVAIVHKEKLIHCHECIKLCYNLIPCSSCTQALYCSESCKEKALNDHHKHECAILATLQPLSIRDEVLLALKATIFSGILNQKEPENPVEGEIFQSGRYKEVHYLTRHVEKIKPFDLFHQAVLAAIVFKVLKEKTELFQNKRIERNFKEIFYRQYQVCLFNPLSINELLVSDDWSPKNMHFGRGLYSFSALLNHSCIPNVVRYFYGSTTVLRATQTIKKGSQCFITYGPQYAVTSTLQRQSTLSEYFFTCTCEACREDWIQDVFQKSCLYCVLTTSTQQFLNKPRKMQLIEINKTKKVLPELESTLRNWEEREAVEGKDVVDELQQCIYECYGLFANRRII